MAIHKSRGVNAISEGEGQRETAEKKMGEAEAVGEAEAERKETGSSERGRKRGSSITQFFFSPL
jgi:hypothetical protein